MNYRVAARLGFVCLLLLSTVWWRVTPVAARAGKETLLVPILAATGVPTANGTLLAGVKLINNAPADTVYLRLTRQGDSTSIALPESSTAPIGRIDMVISPALAAGRYLLSVTATEASGQVLATTSFDYAGAATPTGPRVYVSPSSVGYQTDVDGQLRYVFIIWGTGFTPGAEYGRRAISLPTRRLIVDDAPLVRPSGIFASPYSLDRFQEYGPTYAPPGDYVAEIREGDRLVASAPFAMTGRPAGEPPAPSPSPAPSPPPVPPPPPAGDALCFPSFTPQCVSGRFRAQWEQRGGLAINGYPLTPEIDEVLPDAQGKPQTFRVQYFERVRMEYHPENADPQFQVLLGQFGRQLHPADPPVAALPGATFFPETGHNVTRPAFIGYWQANGGLPQFGYPLSEEIEETLQGPDGQPRSYRVQHFERARFEWHPENPEPYKVQLGQFGRAVCGERCR